MSRKEHRQAKSRKHGAATGNKEHKTEIDDFILREIAPKIGADWEKLASFLGFSAAAISNFKMDSPGQTENQIFNMLVRWKQAQSCSINLRERLCAALERVKRVDLADELRGETGAIAARHLDYSSQSATRSKTITGKSHEEPRYRCRKHKEETMRFFCETCGELVVDHCKPKHRITDTKKASLKCRQALEDMSLAINREIEEQRISLANTSHTKQMFVEQYIKSANNVRNRAGKLMAMVRAEEKRMMDEMKTLRRDRIRQFEEHEKAANSELQRKQHLLKRVREIKRTASDGEVVLHYREICKERESLSGQKHSGIDPRLSYLSFESCRETGGMSLGKLVLDEPESKWNLRCEFGKEGSGPGEFCGSRGITACQPDELVVADYLNNRVVVCDTKGQPKKSISAKGQPFDVARLHDGFVVVGSTKSVRVFRSDCTISFEFPTVPQSEVEDTEVDLRSVAVKRDGTIVVGDVKRKVLTEHSPVDGSLICTVPVKVAPFFLALIDDGKVAISSLVHKVYVIDGDSGAYVNTIKPIIDGDPVKQCTGVCSDSTGIFIAVNNGEQDSGHVHHYDFNGGFLGCVARDLPSPIGVTLTVDEQQLAVANWPGTVKMYHKV